MKPIIYILILLLYITSCSQRQSQNNYVNIPRTKVSIIKPEGYNIVNSFTGLKKDEFQMIMVLDNFVGNYYIKAKKFNKKTFESQGIKVYEFNETKIDGFPAKYMISNTRDINLNSLTLTFGDSTFSAVVTSFHDSNNKYFEEKLKEIFLAIKYDKSKKVDPFEGVQFTVDTNSTDFKFYMFSANNYMFTPFGKNNIDDKSAVMLMTTFIDKSMTLERMSEISLNSMQKHGMYGVMKDSTSQYNTDGCEAYLIIGDCYAELERMYYYQLILAKGNLGVILHGFCNYKNEKMKPEIAEFCRGVRVKN